MEGISFTKHIRQLIEAEGVTNLAKRLNVTRQTIYNWRDGSNTPSTKQLEEMGAVVTFPSNIGPKP